MPALEPLCCLAGFNPSKLTREENQFLEIELFIRVYEELKEYFRIFYREYFYLMRFTAEMEDVVMEGHLFRCVIGDILSTEEYSLSGIACYTATPEDVIYEVAIGRNVNPSLRVARKIIELHRSIKPDFYRGIVNKIAVGVSVAE